MWTQLYVGLAFTTLATLILELSLTRIFSVVFYYHFAFLAISIALFGLGAGGVFSYVAAARPGNLYAKLGAFALADSLCVVASLVFILTRPGDLGNVTLALVYFASALPFFFAGTVVSIAISEAVERVDRAYFWDLAGAAAGCLLLIPFLNLFGGPNTMIAAAVFYGVASAIWFHQAGSVKRRATSVLVALLLVMLIVVNYKAGWIDVRTAKGQRIPKERFKAWNSFSRIGVNGQAGTLESGAYWTIVIDGDATTGVSMYDWDHGITPAQREKLLGEGQGFPYALRPGAKALVIGAGGGYDVARALAGGSHDVMAVEINPIIATDLMRGKLADDSHHIYTRPEVRVHVEDGRSFVRSSTERYQVIQATLVDTWASTAAGAFALSENNLYTTDAFYDYLSHLTDDGMLSFTRWGFDPPRESLRLVTLAMDALGRLGETDPARHVIAVRANTEALRGWGALDTVLISRRAFTAEDVALAQKKVADAHMEKIYTPGDPPSNPFGQLLSAADPQAFLRDYPYDVSPVNDDRPFFFYTVQPRDLWNFFFSASTGSADYKVNRGRPAAVRVDGDQYRGDPPRAVTAALAVGRSPAKTEGRNRVSVVFPVPGRRVHPDSGGADPEIHFAARASRVRAHRDRVLHAGVERIGQLLQPQDRRRRRRAIGVGVGLDRRAGGGARVRIAASGDRGGHVADSGEGADHRALHRPGRIPDGHAVPQRLAPSGAASSALGPVGVVVKRGGERARLGGRDLLRDLSRPAGDVADRRSALPLRAGRDRGDADRGGSRFAVAIHHAPHAFDVFAAARVDAVVQIHRRIAVRRDELDAVAQARLR